MKQLFLFYKLECKRIIKLIPHILAGAIALSLVISAIAFCASKMIYLNKSDKHVDIAYSLEDDSTMTKMIINTLTNSEGISSVCNFIKTTNKDSLELLKNNEVIAAITIPKGFMNSLMTGKNYSIIINLPEKLSQYSIILVEISKAIETTLNAAQAGVYTLYDFYKEQDMLQYEDDANLALNSIYLTKVFGRASAFQSHTVSATGGLSLIEYYICAGIVILLLMLGTTFIDSIKSNSHIMNLKLRQAGIGSQHIALSKIVAIASALFILIYSAVLVLSLLNILGILSLSLKLHTAFVNSILISFCAACVIVFFVSLSKGRTNGMLLLFMAVTVMCFISGCFIPRLFLPDILKSVSDYLPSTHIMSLMEDIVTNKISVSKLLTTLSSGIFLYLCTVLNLHIKKGW